MFEKRLRRLLAVVGVLLAGIFVRCFWIQVIAASDLTKRAPDAGTFVPPRRGDILWADGSAMASSDSLYRVVVDVTRFDATRWRCMSCGDVITRTEAPPNCAECGIVADFDRLPAPDERALAALIGADAEKVAERIARVRGELADETKRRKSSGAATLASGSGRVLRVTAAALATRVAEFPGVEVRAEAARVVDPIAKAVVGSVRFPDLEEAKALAVSDDPDVPAFRTMDVARILIGTKGLERRHDDSLRGAPGLVVRIPGRAGDGPPEPIIRHEVKDGVPLRTTLRKSLQGLAHEIVTASKAPACAAVVLDVRTGAVVAMASKSDDGLNHAATPRDPGSVYKLVTALAELEAGLDGTPCVVCEKTGTLPGTNTRYRCTGTHGPASFEDAFANSCNPYYQVRSLAIGGPALAAAARRLGLDRNYGLGLAGEARSNTPDWDRNDLVNVAIGQGRSQASPLQVAAAYAMIASGGRRVVPFIDRDAPRAPDAGQIDPVVARHARRLVDAAAACVDRGTAKSVSLLGELRAAGKSGTAEVSSKTLNNAWFVAFAPREAPQYVAVVVHEQVEKLHGATSAGPDVARLLEEALRER